MDLSTITNPGSFIVFMESIWDAPCKPGPDGGVIVYQHPEYNDYHDAVKVAREIGLRPSGNTGSHYVFRFANDDGVRIARDGASITQANRYKPRKR